MSDKATRDVLEGRLILKFEGNISPITLDDRVLIDGFKDGNFGRSLMGFSLYVNGINPRGLSSKYPLGLKYYDGENFFGIGYFKKEGDEECLGYIHIIAPTGPTWTQAVDKFILTLERTGIKKVVYFRHLTPDQGNELIDYGKAVGHNYENVTRNLFPWHPSAYQEDETYNHRLVDLESLLNGNNIKNSDLNRAYNRFTNFLTRNNLYLSVEEYSNKHEKDAEQIVRSHFEMLIRKGMAIGSTFEDYQNIIKLGRHSPNNGTYSYIGYLTNESGDLRLPIMFFAGETIDQENHEIGLYATITMRDLDKLPQNLHRTGFTAISEYCYVKIFRRLIFEGIKRADLGGSETFGLDSFKRDKLSAVEKLTRWLAYQIND